MGFAFGITEDDVWAVLAIHKVKGLSDNQVTELFDDLDTDAVESAALEEIDMDAQTTAAHAEIWRQIEGTDPLAPWRAAQAATALEGAFPASKRRPPPRI